MSQEGISILLADDDDGHASLVERNLRRAGVLNRVIRVQNGRQALDYIFARGEYEGEAVPASLVVLLDINMPEVDGIEVLRQLKSNAATSQLPVIMLTTTDDPREIERCYQLGCNIYITKPVDYEEFIEAIRRLGLFLQVVNVPDAPRN
jgi:CheY-like chemotaxis protein